MTGRLHAVLTAAWQSGRIPSDGKRGLIVPTWKEERNLQDCNNYRGIIFLSARQGAEHPWFTPVWSTTDRILCVGVLVERQRKF